MLSTIIKRDGRSVPYDESKIASAIYKAAKAVGGHDYHASERLAAEVTDRLEIARNGMAPTVEQVQDMVESVLIENGHARTAKEYILYRAERSRIRQMNTRLMKTLEELTFKDAKDNELKRENANIDGDCPMGTMLRYGTESAKQFYEMFILNPAHSEAHRVGDIHIHDLDFFTLTTTCCQIDLDRLFSGGFDSGHGFLREPNDIASYSALACIAIQSNQNDQHGGQSVPNFDYALAKGVAKTYRRLYRQNLAKALTLLCDCPDAAAHAAAIIRQAEEATGAVADMSDKSSFGAAVEASLTAEYSDDTAAKIYSFLRVTCAEEIDRATYQSMEALVHNLNTMHSRAGAQVPFSSINYGLDTSPEGRLVIKNILLAAEKGLGHGETPIFPIHIFKLKDGINTAANEPNYDLFKLACRVSAKRLYPNFAFMDAPFNLKYYKPGHPETECAYMGCRTRVIANAYDPERETVFGRGNLSYTSINLPRIAIRSHGNVEFFFEELDRKIDLVIAQLLERFEIQCKKKVRNFPFLMGQGIWLDSEKLSIDDEVREVLRHGTLTIGFIGLAECLKSLVGSHHGQTKEAQNLGLEIIGYMRKRTDEAAAKHRLNFSLIATPGEGLSGRFVKLDTQKYGVIEGVTDRIYYTNSFHIPVYFPISAAEKISLEAPYHELTNGGHISYVELDGDPTENLDAFETIVLAMKKAGVGYGSINHPVDRDPVCGYTGIIRDVCPQCGRGEEDHEYKFERIRRITGYLAGTMDRFNPAKYAETKDRLKHSLDGLSGEKAAGNKGRKHS